MAKKSSLGREIYSGAATFGQINAWYSAIIVTLFVVPVLLVLAYSVISHKNHLKSVSGEVDGPSDTSCSVKDNIKTCPFTVKYEVNGKIYKKTDSSQQIYTGGEPIEVWYDPNDPSIAEINPAPKALGYFILFLALFLLVGVWFWVWVTRKSKFAAAAGGAAAAVDLFRRR